MFFLMLDISLERGNIKYDNIILTDLMNCNTNHATTFSKFSNYFAIFGITWKMHSDANMYWFSHDQSSSDMKSLYNGGI